MIFEINVGSDAYCIPEGTYSSDEGTVNLEYSNHKLYPYGWMDMPDYSSTYNFDYCKLTVEHGEDGLYIIKGEALQWDSFYEYLEPPYNVKTVTKLVWEYHGDLPGFSIM